MRSPCARARFILSNTVSTAISALVLVIPVRLTTSLMMSSLIKTSSRTAQRVAPKLGRSKPHDRIEVKRLSRASTIQISSVDEATFRRACSRFATGIAVATVTGMDGKPYGLTINSFTSVSCCPPLVLICIDYRCNILPHFRSSNFFGVNVLNDGQRQHSIRFSQRQSDRFDGIGWHQGDTGVPLLEGSLSCLECCVTQTVEAGDHAVLFAEVLRAEYNDGKPLLYYGSTYQRIAD